jgi:predicted phosphodiesterase
MDKGYIFNPLTTVAFFAIGLLIAANLAPATAQSWRFGAVGDLDCTDNTQSNVNIFKRQTASLILFIGDLLYECKQSDFDQMWQPFAGKLKASMGNHDDLDIIAKYGFPKDGKTEYYSFDYQGVHFLAMSTEKDRAVGSSQYNFVVNDINQACHDPKTNWIVVFFHKPSITSPTKHPAEKNQFAIYQPVFNGCVDIVLQGHNHVYERNFPVTNDRTAPVIVTKQANYSEGSNATTYLTVGGGGHDLYKFDGTSPLSAKKFSEFGSIVFTVTPQTIKGEYYSTKAPTQVKDQFGIYKDIAPQVEPTPPPEEPNQPQPPNTEPQPPTINATLPPGGKYCNFLLDEKRALLPVNGQWILIKVANGYSLVPMPEDARVPVGTECIP